MNIGQAWGQAVAKVRGNACPLFGLYLRKERDRKGLTQAALAKRLGMPQSSIARFEADACNPSCKMLDKIIDAMGLDTDITYFYAGRLMPSMYRLVEDRALVMELKEFVSTL